jgi:starch-binding outer membrane protein, SusD/RagB family
MKKEFSLYTFVVVSFLLAAGGCKKMIEIDPPVNYFIGNDIYNSNATASSVIIGIYTEMASAGIFSSVSAVSIRAGLSADELIPATSPGDILTKLYQNALTNDGGLLFWNDLYSYVFKINAAIDGIEASTGITAPVKQQLLGEAKFLRAFMYFYLVNFYGDVPLLLTTDPKITSLASRTSTAVVYDHIIKDLKEAQVALNIQYVNADGISTGNTRIRPNKLVATAMLARVYLYTEQWELAAAESSKIINNNEVYQLEPLDKVFLIDSREAIWQLQPVQLFLNTLDAVVLVLAPSEGSTIGGPRAGKPVYLSNEIIDEFQNGDERKNIWTNSFDANGIIYPYAYKYKAWTDGPRTENLVVFRLAEQYLIRAEANAHLGNIAGENSALSDLNVIRNRSGLADIDISDVDNLLQEIYTERKRELFTEWGHRWFDLKRTGTINNVMSQLAKGSGWEPYKSLYPIPVLDIQRNPNLRGKQNPGYPEN